MQSKPVTVRDDWISEILVYDLVRRKHKDKYA